MPTGVVIGIVFIWVVIVAAALAGAWGLVLWFRNTEREHAGWDERQSTLEEILWQQRNEKRRCPHCRGTRCWDFRHNGRTCEKDPTEADGSTDHLMGRHGVYTVQAAPSGYWPLPKTLAARVHRDLWAKVAGHCQIALARPVGVGALP